MSLPRPRIIGAPDGLSLFSPPRRLAPTRMMNVIGIVSVKRVRTDRGAGCEHAAEALASDDVVNNQRSGEKQIAGRCDKV